MKVLLVEDEVQMSEAIASLLKKNQCLVECAFDGDEGYQMGLVGDYDVIIMDIMLPVMDGYTAVSKLRAAGINTPIIMLTALSSVEDKVKGLDIGADDYLTKPFRIGELRARVAAHLRRQQRTPAHRLVRGGVMFDLAAGTAETERGPVTLTKGEYAICEVLALHAGQTFGKEQLYTEAFGYERAADASAVTEHIKNIRAKFRAAGCEPVETVWGVGYRWKR